MAICLKLYAQERALYVSPQMVSVVLESPYKDRSFIFIINNPKPFEVQGLAHDIQKLIWPEPQTERPPR